MNWISPLVGRSLLCAALALSLFGCGKTESTDDADKTGELSTPQKTLEAAKTASSHQDYKKLCGYFTPNGRRDIAAGFVFAGGFMLAGLENPGIQENSMDEDEREKAEKVKALFKKYGLTRESVPKVNIDVNAGKEEQKKEMRKLADPIKDHCQFVVDFLTVIDVITEKPEARLIDGNFEMQDLKIDGDKASARLVRAEKGGEETKSIEFRKVDGQWLIEEI